MVAQQGGAAMSEKKLYRFLGSFTFYPHGCGGGSYFSGEMRFTPEEAEALRSAGAEMVEVTDGGATATPIPPPYASNSGW